MLNTWNWSFDLSVFDTASKVCSNYISLVGLFQFDFPLDLLFV